MNNFQKNNIKINALPKYSQSSSESAFSPSQYNEQTLCKRDYEVFVDDEETEMVNLTEKEIMFPDQKQMVIKNNKKDKHVNDYEGPFENLKITLPKIFLNIKISEEEYDKCSSFEKVCMKHFLVKKLGIEGKNVCLTQAQIISNTALSFEDFVKLTQITSSKRKNEVIEHIIKIFIENDINLFFKANIDEFEEEFKDPLFVKKLFFGSHFNIENYSKEELRKIITSFFKAKFIKNPGKKPFLNNPKKYSKNYKYSNMLNYIKKSPILKANLMSFLEEENKNNIFAIYRKTIKAKFVLKFEEMEEDLLWNCMNKTELYLPFLQEQLKNIKYKMPMMILDLLKYSRVIKECLDDDDL
jgi:hypothetical protein